MQYLDYQEYVSIGGVCDTTAFNRNLYRAYGVIDRDTHNRAENEEIIPDYIKHLCRDLIEYYATNGNVAEKDVASWSESGGPVSESVSYVSKTTADMESDIEALLSEYLDGKYTSKGVLWRYKGAMY